MLQSDEINNQNQYEGSFVVAWSALGEVGEALWEPHMVDGVVAERKVAS